jgi:NAD(P)-dependent dehydrogenase (short-subunit alcohol dehydrogenase family)
MPGAGLYAASKAAVNAVSDTWAHELAEYGIRSISIQASRYGFDLRGHSNAELTPSTPAERLPHEVFQFCRH